MTRIRDLFPLLAELPPLAAELGLSLDSTKDELCSHADDDDVLSRVLRAFVPHLIEAEDRKLAALLPGLQLVRDGNVETTVRKNRSRNALSRAGIKTWADIAEVTPRDLRLLPSVGALTIGDILSRCVEASVLGVPKGGDDVAEGLPEGDDELGKLAADRATKILRIVAAWAASERNVERLGDVWQLHSEGGVLPTDLGELWQELAEMHPAELADWTLRDSRLEDLIDDLMSGLEETHRKVYELRVLAAKPSTLEEVGQVLGFTRERARQIQVKAQDRVDSLVQSDRFRPILWRASDLRGILGLAALKDSEDTANALEWCLRDVGPAKRELATRLLLTFAGPYRERDGWLELVGAPVVEARELATIADENGLISIDEAYKWLTGRGVDPAFQDAWIDRTGKFRRFDGHLAVWSGSLVDKCVAVLALRSRPTETEVLVTAVAEGHNPRGARDRFFSDPRLMRVNRTQWALRSWGLEEYTGITDELAQRIEAAGGRVRLTEVAGELTLQFGVKEGSVKVYAEAPMFVVEDGWVRVRRDDEPFPISGDLASCRGAYVDGLDHVTLLLPVDRDTLRGSGRSCPAAVADVMGVSPGRPRIFRWDGGELLVTWPRTAAFGPSIGSTRALAASVEATVGDYVRLDFDLSSGEVACCRVPSSLNGLSESEALKTLTGLDLRDGDDVLERLAAALRVSPSEVRRRLSDRGDAAVAALVPTPEIDGALESALSELAELLDDLD